MRIICPEFRHKGTIPRKYTCEGDNVNPPFLISDVSSSVMSMVLIMDDPDAPGGTFTHWLVYNIPVAVEVIHEDCVPGIQLLNDFKIKSYGGPCPPSGTHRYFFKLYGLDCHLDLSRNATKPDLHNAMEGHVVESTQLIGVYQRMIL